MSNVVDSHNSLYSFKYKTKAFLLHNELISGVARVTGARGQS